MDIHDKPIIPNTLIKDITIIIPLQSNNKIVRDTLYSIRKFYPSIKIYLADQRDCHYSFNHIDQYYYLGFNKGINYCRNYLLKKVTTSYFFLLNDNLLFTHQTLLEYLLIFLITYNLDIVLPHIHNTSTLQPYSLTVNNEHILSKNFNQPLRSDEFPLLYHGGAPCFLGKTAALIDKKIKWDDAIKIDNDQIGFFYQVKDKLKISYVSNVLLELNSTINKYIDYSNKCYKSREKNFYNLQVRKLHVKSISNNNTLPLSPQTFIPSISFTKNFIFGLGTGRCGTQSLAQLLNHQRDSFGVHEGTFYYEYIDKKKIKSIGGSINKSIHLPWNVNIDILMRILLLMEELDYQYVGDVAFYYLPYVELILNLIPSAKFIALKRNREEVIRSFKEKTSNNYWYKEYKPSINVLAIYKIWNPCFPKYDIADHHDAIGHYWDQYYQRVENLMTKYPQNIRILETKDLNNKEEIQKLLFWVGYSNPKSLIIHLNSNH